MEQIEFKYNKEGNLKTSLTGLLYLLENNYILNHSCIDQINDDKIRVIFFDKDTDGIDLIYYLTPNEPDDDYPYVSFDEESGEEVEEFDLLIIDEVSLASEYIIPSDSLKKGFIEMMNKGIKKTEKELQTKKHKEIKNNNLESNTIELEDIFDDIIEDILFGGIGRLSGTDKNKKEIIIIHDGILDKEKDRDGLKEFSNFNSNLVKKEKKNKKSKEQEYSYEKLLDMYLEDKKTTIKNISDKQKEKIIKEEAKERVSEAYSLDFILQEVKNIMED